jgi:malate synthase
MVLRFTKEITQEQASVLTFESILFVKSLCEKFTENLGSLLSNRGNFSPGFLSETEEIRSSSWKVLSAPDDIQDRRVEITGPPDRKMIINALNSGANVYMADFEDSNSPTWENCINGQINLRDAINKEIDFYDEKREKSYALKEDTAVLFVRPRGLHLKESHIEYENQGIPAAFFDFGVYIANNILTLVEQGRNPYFYLPKLEHYKEARLWNDIFSFTEEYFGVEHGTIKATVLIETLPAAFQMDEILYELKDHSAGLNCGRWDYIFSFIKTFKEQPDFVVPDRDSVGMNQHFMRSYSQLLIQTCHKRGAHAMGGMAAQIPIKNNPVANATAIRKVEQDKLREVLDGHDGTWVAHPGLVSIAKNIFDEHMPNPNQINNPGKLNREIKSSDLTTVPVGACTETMLRKNIKIGYEYLRAWVDGSGCVPLNNLMEDAATAEISRAQTWQWIRHNVTLDNGNTVTKEYVGNILSQELTGESGLAFELFKTLCLQDSMDEFLTLKAYDVLSNRQ